MPQKIKDVMKEAGGQSLQREIQKLKQLNMNEIVYQSLSAEQIDRLVRKINLLPTEYRNILFLRHCFGNTDLEIDKLLETENTKSKLLYVHEMLSRRVGLDDSWIDNDSMVNACELALKEEEKDYDSLKNIKKLNYSKGFRRKLKDIKSAQNSYGIYIRIVKKAAIFILISILGFSTALTINAGMREKFFHWVIEKFSEYSILKTQRMDNGDSNDLNSFKINYVPKGFELSGTNEGRSMLIYNYSAENNQKITIRLFASEDEEQSYYNTENSEVETFILKRFQAYTWKTKQLTYLIWYQDGIECRISATLDKDEMIKIAENITKK